MNVVLADISAIIVTSREAERGFPRSTREVCVMLVAAVQRSAVQLGKTEKTTSTRSLTSTNHHSLVSHDCRDV